MKRERKSKYSFIIHITSYHLVSLCLGGFKGNFGIIQGKTVNNVKLK